MVQDSDLGEPCLRVGNPAAALVRCKEKVFLALMNIIGLRFGGETDLQDLELKYLADKTAKVDFQILRMVPAAQDDDPSDEYDWCWSQAMEVACHDVPGRLICMVNPGIIIHEPGKPMYLFKSLALLVLAGYLHRHLSPRNINSVPIVKRTLYFPYRFKGKACFLIEGSEGDTIGEEGSLCTKCGPRTSLDRMNAQCIIEHMATHILYDPTIRSHPQEHCGLCLGPSPMCAIYLKKGRGRS